MLEDVIIRRETEADYRAVEELTREAFWNVYVPGASEHYFVHTMRNHPDFIPELAFVLELNGEIVGNIMYTKAWLEDENGERYLDTMSCLEMAEERGVKNVAKSMKTDGVDYAVISKYTNLTIAEIDKL